MWNIINDFVIEFNCEVGKLCILQSGFYEEEFYFCKNYVSLKFCNSEIVCFCMRFDQVYRMFLLCVFEICVIRGKCFFNLLVNMIFFFFVLYFYIFYLMLSFDFVD